MEGTMVKYNGRNIAKEGFRAFIYGPDNTKKLVNSWEEYELCIKSGEWFTNPEEVFQETKIEDVRLDKLEKYRKRGK